MVEKAMKEVFGLAQRLALHRAQALVPRQQHSELLLQWNRLHSSHIFGGISFAAGSASPPGNSALPTPVGFVLALL